MSNFCAVGSYQVLQVVCEWDPNSVGSSQEIFCQGGDLTTVRDRDGPIVSVKVVIATGLLIVFQLSERGD
jgi:hypothetical protein